VLLAIGLAFWLGSPVAAQGASGAARDQVCQGIVAGGGTCDNDGSIDNVIKVIINVISAIAGAVAVIMIVLAGMRYITSGGESSKIAGAKSAIIYAIVGLVVVALSQVIVRFVLNKAI
jgi:hypothetical protein